MKVYLMDGPRAHEVLEVAGALDGRTIHIIADVETHNRIMHGGASGIESIPIPIAVYMPTGGTNEYGEAVYQHRSTT